MRIKLLIPVLLLVACNTNEPQPTTTTPDTLQTNTGATQVIKKITPAIIIPKPNVYENKRFRNVTVERVSENKYRIKGQGQIFEANFNWIVEDGHEELKKGFQMTDAGAPEWGNFDFTIEAKKKRENSSLTLLLFETSAKDGSRQYELAVPL